ncbi:AAA family ATPase [Streptomyces sp. NPDC005498]|uniref:helix-turn-helix transcriptional regulator n=1 Tax=Streptomyces sp. NPDC005498 TaxID=3364717 RepID=UPI003676C41D
MTEGFDPSPGGAAAPGSSHHLIGRKRELSVVEEFLARVRDRGAALFLYGEPGVGKTRLLDAAARGAAALGTRVLRETGVQYRADVSYGTLRELLLPLAARLDKLPPQQRDALTRALGMTSGAVPDRLMILNAALALLRGESESGPVLLVVDDLPWIDRPSAAALGFVARRLAGARLGIITASRLEENDPFMRGGLPRLLVRPLDDTAADTLVGEVFPTMPPRVRRRVVAESRGNPLALLELSSALTPAQLTAVEGLPDVLPLTGHIEAVFTNRIARLPAETRRALVILAQEGTGDFQTLQRAASGQPILDQLAPAESAKLVKVDMTTRKVLFRHPLVRSAVVESATDADLRHIHRTLADLLVYDSNRSAWHLAQAACGPDERVAALLEDTAHRKIRRGDATGAMRALTRAAELSEDEVERSRRLAENAYLAACVIGEPATAIRLLDESRQFHPRYGGSLHAAAAKACTLLNGEGDSEAAYSVLVEAIHSGDHGYQASRSDLVDALDMLLTVCRAAGREDYWPAARTAVGRLRPAPPEALWLMSETYPDPVRATADARRRLAALIDGQDGEADPQNLLRINASAVHLDQFGGCRSSAWRIIENSRAGGAVRSGLSSLAQLGLDSFGTGRWEEAETLADDGLQLARSLGYAFVSWEFHLLKALLGAVRGDEQALVWADELTRVAVGRKAYGAARTADHPRALAALGGGDFEAAYRLASRVSPPGRLAPYSPHAPWMALDLVEAAVRTGRQTEAEAHVRALCDGAVDQLSSRLHLLVRAAQALVAPDEEAIALYDRAVTTPGARHWPFDHARVQLLYGERLRRMRAAAEARSHLTTAVEIFWRLGAVPWEKRAARELRASGHGGSHGTAGNAAESLTSQEFEIASLAAEGLTNKQIGERLFLSPRTVGTHLYRIFPKLDITSRAALRDALSRQ